jgi:2-oxoglutarate dehydrogenase E1 component
LREPVFTAKRGPLGIELEALLNGENGGYIEALFEDYVTGSAQIPEEWRERFEQLLGASPRPAAAAAPAPALRPAPAAETRSEATGIFGLVNAYRGYGHLLAQLDPLTTPPERHPLLEPEEFGIKGERLDQSGPCGNYLGLREGTPRDLIESLRRTYCGTIAAEFMEIRDKERRDWLVERMEPYENRPALSREDRRRILGQVLRAERLEQFLHKRFLGQKRFSVEGGESLLSILDELAERGAALGVETMVIAMAHRGRLNVLCHTMGMPYPALLAEFQKGLVPLNAQGSGDVKYHRGYSSDRTTREGHHIHLTLCPNPSHLEAINPVAEGMARAKQNLARDYERRRVIPLQIHGDAAFTGQGVVAETLALSELEGYWTGGTIHIVVNNQIGFTTEPRDYRFTKYPSDMAKVIQPAIFHVNADDPEACVHAARMAIEFRQQFREDVIIDLVCYRRHGHNEGDDPTFTQPLIYKKINTHDPVGRIYADRLVKAGVLSREELTALEAEIERELEAAYQASQVELHTLTGAQGYHGLWAGRSPLWSDEPGATAVAHETLSRVARALVELPAGFTPHRKVQRLLESRAEAVQKDQPIDWGTGEALAIGSLLLEGTTVRLAGQDAERGTFVHRHGVLHDVETGDRFAPLAQLATGNAALILVNSPLSEAAALGFEYGYSCVDPTRLVIWEAQFGDFANGAQIIIDQFISSAEQKWGRSSGLVLLLPHGYDGQGPEHSSARLERFLQLCAEDNLQVCNLTTPAQIFHALRRQIHRSVRKPLVVMSPKSLLRHAKAVSTVADFAQGQFQTLIDDSTRARGKLNPAGVRRVLLCSGKVYYTLSEAREIHAFDDVAIVRLEQIHPFPFDAARALLAEYETRDFVWVQEEPWNMGAWSFVQERMRQVLPKGARLRYVGRPESASPATGSYRAHEQQEAAFVEWAFAPGVRPRRENEPAGS